MKTRKCLNFLILALVLFVLACGSKDQTAKENQPGAKPEAKSTSPQAPEVITSTDQVSSVTAEGGWKPATGLHPKAQLQASNSYGDMYLVVFSEKKDRYSGVTLEDYSEVTRGHILDTLTSPSISNPRQFTIDGNSGLQYDIHGYVKNAKIGYVHTAVETPLYFHEIILWTPDDRFERNHFAMENAINSFKEVKLNH